LSSSVDVTPIQHIMFLGLEAGELLLYVPYDGSTDVSHDLRAALLRAVMHFTGDDIRSIRWSNFMYVFEPGEISIAIMGLKAGYDEEIYRGKLLKMLYGFEREYRLALQQDTGDIRRYKNFALAVITEMPLLNIDLDLVPTSKEDGEPIPWRVGEVDVKLEILQHSANGKRTIRDIVEMTQMPEREVIALSSILAYFEWIEF
ncbi:MAG: hypothetical protein ACXADO_08490, partial [Candidatus Thorarchaeota archaeon]